MVLRDLPLEICKVDGIAAVFIDERALHELAVIVPDHLKERVIYGRLDQYRVARLRCRADRHGQRKHDAGRFHKPLGLRLPAEPPRKPARNGRGIVRFGIAVAAVASLSTAKESILPLPRAWLALMA